MSGRENYIAGKIDRKREHASSKQARTARSMFIRAQARRMVLTAANDFDGREKAAFLEDAADIVAELLHPLIGRVPAATRYNAIAADICGPLKLPRAIAAAEAERLFTKAANDEGGCE